MERQQREVRLQKYLQDLKRVNEWLEMKQNPEFKMQSSDGDEEEDSFCLPSPNPIGFASDEDGIDEDELLFKLEELQLASDKFKLGAAKGFDHRKKTRMNNDAQIAFDEVKNSIITKPLGKGK